MKTRSVEDRLETLEGRVSAMETVIRLQSIALNLSLRWHAAKVRKSLSDVLIALPLDQKWSQYGQHLDVWDGHYEALAEIDMLPSGDENDD